MITLSKGYELYTALTNVVILLIGISGSILLKKDKLWKLLFSFLAIDGFMGVIIHGLTFSESTLNILWFFLLIMFALTINTALCIFSKWKIKYIVILSIILSIILLIELFLGLDFLTTFFIYSIVVVLLCLYFVIKSNKKNKIYILLSFIIMISSTLPEFFKIVITPLNYDALSHLILSIGLIILLITIKKEK